jgi:hypothetical protein
VDGKKKGDAKLTTGIDRQFVTMDRGGRVGPRGSARGAAVVPVVV